MADTIERTTIAFEEWRASAQLEDTLSQQVKIGVGDETVFHPLGELDRAHLELRLELIRHAREIFHFLRFDTRCKEASKYLTRTTVSRQTEALHFIQYQKALAATSQWKSEELRHILSSWDTTFFPLWALRRAGLMFESDQWPLAEQILTHALEELRAVTDEGTPESWSIESWVIYSLKLFEKYKNYSAVAPDTGGNSHAAESVNPALIGESNWQLRSSALPDEQLPKDKLLNRTIPTVDLEGELAALRLRSCDPEDIVDWVNLQNQLEYQRPPITTRRHAFDSRHWTHNVNVDFASSNQRGVAAYRTMRLIEEAGIPLRVRNVWLDFALAKRAASYLVDLGAKEATGAVLRLSDDHLIKHWFSRSRLATTLNDAINRLISISESALRKVIEQPELLERDSPATREFKLAAELLSRTIIRADESKCLEILRLAVSLPTRIQLGKRPWLLDGVAQVARRTCESMSFATFQMAIADLMRSPVQGSFMFPQAGGHNRWIDPIMLLDRRPRVEASSAPEELSKEIDTALEQVALIGTDPLRTVERQNVLLRLVTLADRGFLTDGQLERLGGAFFVSRGADGFPANTGCFDSAVLLLPQQPGIDEYDLFRTKYVVQSWPEGAEALMSLLGSLARTGPLSRSAASRRHRAIQWTRNDLRMIVRRCRETVIAEAEAVERERPSLENPHPVRQMFPKRVDRAREIFDIIGGVLDEVVLKDNTLPTDILKVVIDAIDVAENLDLSILRAYPKLSRFERRYRTQLESALIERLTCPDENSARAGFFALNHWANQLADRRIPRISDPILHSVLGFLQGEYSQNLIHALDTLANLLQRLPNAQARRFLRTVDRELPRWSRRLKYESLKAHSESDRLIEPELPDLRASMTRLCIRALGVDKRHVVATEWLELAGSDPMPEIKQILEEALFEK